MAKKRQTEDAKEFSTVFSDPRKKREDDTVKVPKKKRNKLKRLLCIVISAVIVLVGALWMTIQLVDSPVEKIKNKGPSNKTYEQWLETVDESKISTVATELYGLKNPDIKDKGAFERMAELLQVEQELGTFELTVLSDSKPYAVYFSFNYTHHEPTDDTDFWLQNMMKYCCVIMSLVDNVAQVKWDFPLESGGQKIGTFTRADAQKYYDLDVSPQRFAESEKSVQLMLTYLGINIY